jgi:hypothetical protein
MAGNRFAKHQTHMRAANPIMIDLLIARCKPSDSDVRCVWPLNHA